MYRENVHSHTLNARKLRTASVIVYSDRAEVKKIVSVDVKKGINEVILKNISSVVERQSLRVDVSGTVSIQEVQYQEMPLDSNSPENNSVSNLFKIRKLEEEKNDLESKRMSLSDEINVLKKRVEVLDGVAGQISKNVITPVDKSDSHSDGSNITTAAGNNAFLLNDNTISNLTRFLDFYSSTVSEIKVNIRKKSKKFDELLRSIDSLERQIDQMRCSFEYDCVERNICVTISAEEDETVQLYITYQVYCANWRPTYDIRVSMNNEDSQADSLKIRYYGIIEQNTGENWESADLVLSTATPSIGGVVPSMSTLAAGFQSQTKECKKRNASSLRKPNSATSDEDMGFGSFDYNDITDAVALQKLTAAAAALPTSDLDLSFVAGSEQLPCSYFLISEPATVYSDGTEHKVLVAEITTKPKFLHETVPAHAQVAYATATALNTSKMTLLPGPASVYLNASFIAKTQLGVVLPGDEFSCSLGADPSIKVEYKPAVRSKEHIGFVSKNALQTKNQPIYIRNAKLNRSVNITVKENVPKSTDDRIKVNLISPEMKTAKNAKLNKENNLEWTFILEPGESREVQVKWSIEYPINETIVYRQVLQTVA
uniref:DUF4139 domain-containing protein n=1 Tax=Syphacia muris TaxID=451379 RepID=A0A0N5ARG6_9BILA